MDLTTMKRKELQSLCKSHGIPANLSNAEMAKRLSSLLEVNEKKKTRSCSQSVNNEVDNVDEVNKKVKDKKKTKSCIRSANNEVGNVDEDSKKVGKRVKFSPENETFEFERTDPRACRLLARKRRSMAKPDIEADQSLVSDNAKNPVGNSRNPKRKTMENSQIEGNSLADVGCLKKPVGRNLRRKSMAVSVSEGVSNIDMFEEKGNDGRNVRRRSVMKIGEGLMSDDVEIVKPTGGENVGRNLRRKSMSVSVFQDASNLEMVEQEGKSKKNVKKSVVKIDKDLVSEDAGKLEKSIHGGNVGRNWRSRGKNMMKGDEELTLVSPHVERGAKRGRKGNQVVNEGCDDGVDNKVIIIDETETDVMVTRRRLRSREVRLENSGKADDDLNEKIENVMPVPRRSSRQTNKGKSGDDSLVGNGLVKDAVTNQNAVKNQSQAGERKRVGKKTSSVKQQEVKKVIDKGTDKVNINIKKSEENINVEKDCGIKEMPPKSSNRRAKGLTKVETSLNEPVLDEIVPQSSDHTEDGEKETVDVLTSDGKPNGCDMENVDDVGTDHTSAEEPTPVSIDETASAISLEQKQEKGEVDMDVCVTSPLSLSMVDFTEPKDSIEKELVYKERDVQSSAKNERPSPSLLQGDCFEGKSAVQNSNMEMPSKAHVSSISSWKDCECILPVINAKMFDGVVDVAEPDCGFIAKPSTPCSSRAVNIGGESSTAAAAVVQKSDSHLMKQEGLFRSREISDNISKESGGVTPEICSLRRADQHFQDEKTSGDANQKPSFASSDLASAFAASVPTEYDMEKEGVGNQPVTPKQNPEVGSGSKNHKEPKVVDSQSTDFGESSPKSVTMTISYLFASSQVDEQCNADKGKSEPEDVTEPNYSIITNSTSPRTSKVGDVDHGKDNMENAEERKTVDQSDDQIVQEATAFTREISDDISTESECMAAENSHVQILDHYIAVEKVDIALEANVKENTQPAAILDGSTHVSPAPVPDAHTLMKENVDIETTTPSQNLGGGFCRIDNQESSGAFSGSISVGISSLFRQSPIKEECRANEDYTLTEEKEETFKENIQLSEEGARRLNLMYGVEKSEKCTESNNIVQMAAEVKTIAKSPANNRNSVPLLHNDGASCIDAVTPTCTSTIKLNILESSKVINDEGLSCQQFMSVEGAKGSCQRSNGQSSKLKGSSIAESGIESKLQDGKSGDQILIVVDQEKECEWKDEQVVDLGEESEPKDDQVEDQDKEPEPTDDQVEDQEKEPELIDDQVVDLGKEPEPKDGQVEDQGKELDSMNDQVVDQEKEPEPIDDQVEDQGKEPGPIDDQVINQGKESKPMDHQVVDQEEESEPMDDQVEDQEKEPEPTGDQGEDQGKEPEPMNDQAVDQWKEPEPTNDQVEDQGKEPKPMDAQVADQGKESEPADDQMEDQGKEPEPKDDQVEDQGNEPELLDAQVEGQGNEPEQKDDLVEDQGKEPEPIDDQVVDQGKESEMTDDQVGDQGKEPEAVYDQIEGQEKEPEPTDQMEDQGKEPEPTDDQHVDQEEELGPKEGGDSTFKETECTTLEVLSTDELRSETSAAPPIVIGRLSPLSEASLCKLVEKAVETNSVTPQQSQETEFRSIDEDTHIFKFQATDHMEDIVNSFPNINTKLLISHPLLDDELVVSHDSLKKGEESEREIARDLSCFNNLTKLDYSVEHDVSAASQKPEDSRNFMDAKLHDTDLGDGISNSDSIAPQTWQNTSEDEGSDTPQRACSADDRELCWTTSILNEDDQDCKGDVESLENVNSAFLESAMVTETKPETSRCDLSLSAGDKSLIEAVSLRSIGSSPHCSSPLSKFHKALDYDGIQSCCDGDSLSVNAWIDHAGEKESEVSGSENEGKAAELSGVADVYSEKFNTSRVLTGVAEDEGDKIVAHPDMNDEQNQYQMYLEQKAAYDSGYEHVPSQMPSDRQGSPRGTDGMTTTKQIDRGLSGFLDEGNQELENSTESCMFSKWELEFIYGEMAKDINEFAEGASGKSTSKSENDIVNANPQEHDQIKPLQFPGNFHEASPDRKHGKITATDTANPGHIDVNKVANPSSMIKRNINRSILIHGTPKKPVVFTHDMKENPPAAKMLKMVDVTAVKPNMKRKALGDLRK